MSTDKEKPSKLWNFSYPHMYYTKYHLSFQQRLSLNKSFEKCILKTLLRNSRSKINYHSSEISKITGLAKLVSKILIFLIKLNHAGPDQPAKKSQRLSFKKPNR